MNWSKDLTAAHAKTIREKKAAKDDWQDDVDLGLTTKDFAGWIEDGNGQLYTTALSRENEIQTKIEKLQCQINVPKGTAMKAKRLGITKAVSDRENPG